MGRGLVDNLNEFLAAGQHGVDKRQHGGLPLIRGLDYLSFGSTRELAQGVAAVTTAAGLSAMSSGKV
jgi:hypothetical protein